jgi:hypothetical protein
VLADNHTMLRICGELGFTVERDAGDEWRREKPTNPDIGWPTRCHAGSYPWSSRSPCSPSPPEGSGGPSPACGLVAAVAMARQT